MKRDGRVAFPKPESPRFGNPRAAPFQQTNETLLVVPSEYPQHASTTFQRKFGTHLSTSAHFRFADGLVQTFLHVPG